MVNTRSSHNRNMVPNDSRGEGEDSAAYLSAVEEDDNSPSAECKEYMHVKRIPPLPPLPVLRDAIELTKFFALVEALLSEAELDMNSIRVKMAVIDKMKSVPAIYTSALDLIHSKWPDLRQNLCRCYSSTSRIRTELDRKISDLKFDKDSICNQIRSLNDWFGRTNSCMSSDEFIKRVFSSRIIPSRFLEKLIERADSQFPGVYWKHVDVNDLCDQLEDICRLFAELDGMRAPVTESAQKDRVRRVPAATSKPSGSPWLEEWARQFQSVVYVRLQDSAALDKAIAAAAEHKVMRRRADNSEYHLLGFHSVADAENGCKGLPNGSHRPFQFRPSKN